MNRRALVRRLLAAVATLPFPSLRAWAQTRDFPGEQGPTLLELAKVVLPASLGDRKIADIAEAFSQWVRDYRPGAEMEHGYGFTRLRNKPASPAPAYLRQLASLALAP